jgi:hypothetical protein
MGTIGMQNVSWTVCWGRKERKELGYSLRRDDSPSMISRSARDLPKLMMTFPAGWDRLFGNRNSKEQENDRYSTLSRTIIKSYSFL